MATRGQKAVIVVLVVLVILSTFAIYFTPETASQVKSGGAATHSWLHYQQKLTKLCSTAILTMSLGMLVYISSGCTAMDKLLPAATPKTLALIRVSTCSFILANVCWEDLASLSLLPSELIRPTGVMQFLHLSTGISDWLREPFVLNAWKWATATVVLFALAGIAKHVTLPLATGMYLVFGGLLREYSHAFHSGLIPLYLLAILAAAEWVSFFQVRTIGNSREADILRCRWTYYACWCALALPYLAAGLSKLRIGGLDWWSANNIRAYLVVDSLNPMEFDSKLGLLMARAPDPVLASIGIGALLLELSFPAVLFSAYARRLLPAGAALMHIGIWMLQNVLFLDAILLQLTFLYLAWLPRASTDSDSNNGNATSREHALGSTRWTRLPAIVSAATVAILVASWVASIEAYPMSAWPMYAMKTSATHALYYRVNGHFEDDTTEIIHLDECIPSMADGRFRDIIWMAFSDERKRDCDAFLAVALREFNSKKRDNSPRLIAIAIQRWQCPLMPAALHAPYGRVVNEHRYGLNVSLDRSHAASFAKGNVE